MAKILHDRWSWRPRQIWNLWPWHMNLIDHMKYVYCIIYIDHLKNIGHVILIDHMNYIGHIIFIDHRKYIDLPIHWRSCSGRQLTQVLSLISNTASNAAKLATRTMKEEWRMPTLFCVYLDQSFLLAPKRKSRIWVEGIRIQKQGQRRRVPIIPAFPNLSRKNSKHCS